MPFRPNSAVTRCSPICPVSFELNPVATDYPLMLLYSPRIPPIEAHSLIYLSLSADDLVEQPQDERPLHVG